MYMRHNNCLTRKLCTQLFLHKHQLWTITRYAYERSHVCLRPRQLKQLLQQVDFSSNTTQTCLWLTVNSFPKSQILANVNMLSDLLKSRL